MLVKISYKNREPFITELNDNIIYTSLTSQLYPNGSEKIANITTASGKLAFEFKTINEDLVTLDERVILYELYMEIYNYLDDIIDLEIINPKTDNTLISLNYLNLKIKEIKLNDRGLSLVQDSDNSQHHSLIIRLILE